MKNKQTDKNLQRILIIILIIVVNLLSIYVFFKIDLTKNKSYTLSNSSKKGLKYIKEPIHIKLFFSKNLPSEVNTIKTYVKDLLTEYQSYSNGKIDFEFINPNSDKLKRDAQISGIPAMTIQVMQNDKMEYQDIYIGMTLSYKGRLEKLPVITSTEGLEYQISTAIKRLVNPRLKNVAYFTPISFEESKKYDDLPDDPNLQFFKGLLSANYVVDRTDLYYPLPKETDLLVVSGIQDSLNEVQLYLLDQYLMSGKPLMIFQDRYQADLNQDVAPIINSNIIPFLFFNSIYIKPNLVLDAYCYQITKNRKQGEYVVPVTFEYPFFPVLQNTNKNHPITKRINYLQSLYCSELFYKKYPGLDFTPLLSSSPNSGERMGKEIETDYRPFQNIVLASIFNDSSKVIAGLYQGSFKSFFKNRTMRADNYIERGKPTNVIVVASNSFVQNDMLSNIKGNAEFLLNSVDYLTNNTGLIEMRSRDLLNSPIGKTRESHRQIAKICNFALPVVLLLSIGLIMFLKNLKYKSKIDKLFKRK